MLAGRFELATLVCDLTEQARVLYGQGRLGREGAEQLDDLRRELARSLADEDQAADDLFLTEERHREHRPKPSLDSDVADAALVCGRLGHVGDLDRLSHLRGPPRDALALPDGRAAEGLGIRGVEVVGGAAVELLAPLVILVDQAPVGTRELARP